MTVYYVSNTMHVQDFAEMFTDTSTMPGQQNQKFNRLLIEGFAANDTRVHAVSALPITRDNCTKRFLRHRKRKDGGITYHYLPVINLPVIKKVMQMIGAFLCVCKAKKGDVVICDVLNVSVSMGAAIGAKLRNIKCAGIVTDLPFYMLPGEMRDIKYEKMVDRVLKSCSHYILLTEQMDSLVNPKHKPYLVLEGVCDNNINNIPTCRTRDKTIKCMYAGVLCEGYGSALLVDGFLAANIEDAELHLYGRGAYVAVLKKICAEHKNIIYHGEVPNKDVVQAELDADLLINSRPTSEEFTKYSFPSKNMEYMASGTAVLTTHLPGMPDEYLPYVFLIKNESTEGVAMALKSVLSLSREERDDKGAAAKKFVMDKKNNKYQTKKILEFIQRRNA